MSPPEPQRRRLDCVDPFFQFPEALEGDCVEAWRLFVANPERSRQLASRVFSAAAKPDGKDDPEGRQKNRRVEIAVRTR